MRAASSDKVPHRLAGRRPSSNRLRAAHALHYRTYMNDDKHTVDAKVARALWLGQLGRRRRRVAQPSTARRTRPLDLVEVARREGAGRPLIIMSYAVGDYVVPTDLPRPFLCRVTLTREVGDTIQILEMEPLEGPWPLGTRLIRGGGSVRPAAASELTDHQRPRAPGARLDAPRSRRQRPSAARTETPLDK
jgi:hypothetical protein